VRIFTTLPQENLAKVGPAAQAIEAAGYTGVSTQENRHEPFLSLAVAGAATKRIELHTGVAIAFARSPMAVANVGWDLASSFGGSRVTLGIGSQVRAVVAAGAAHPRVRAGGAGDLGGVEGRRQAQL
jgi:alkanesulfonate monooxygenase SsuD/methylene tetrahydromethanopterin reductase-like flavin-dependent oxidoreductase (luciferase family)